MDFYMYYIKKVKRRYPSWLMAGWSLIITETLLEKVNVGGICVIKVTVSFLEKEKYLRAFDIFSFLI